VLCGREEVEVVRHARDEKAIDLAGITGGDREIDLASESPWRALAHEAEPDISANRGPLSQPDDVM